MSLPLVLSTTTLLAASTGAVRSAPPEHEWVIPELEQEATILWDSWGVPHLRTEGERDSWVVLGFAHARDRFFQMDYTRRLINGTRAELLGESYVTSDHDIRRIGLVWAAEQLWDDLGDADREVLEAYTEGVNAWIAAVAGGHPDLTFPPEYADLGVSPTELAPWEPLHTIQILGGFIFGLTQAIDADLARTYAVLTLPPDVCADVVRIAPSDTVPALYEGEYPDHLRPAGPPAGDGARPSASTLHGADAAGDDFEGLQEAVEEARALLERVFSAAPWLRLGGSNAWTVAASRSATQRAIFASDNHVGTPLPPVYHEAHLTSAPAGFDVYGVTIPGAPVFANGFNTRVAWAYTVLPADGTDLFWERLPLPNKVFFMGRLVDVEVRPETYLARVDGELVDRTDLVEDPFTRYVPHHGPVLATALFGRRALTYRWVGFEKATFVEPLLRRMRATDAEEAMRASQAIDVFGANMVVADVEGDIAYTVTGTFPIRIFKDLFPPFWPRLGGGLWEWRGRLGPEDYVQSLAPQRGYIATSNNDPVGYSFDNRLTNDPVYYAIGHDPGFRQRRIHQELNRRTPISIEDVMEIQRDVTVALADRLLDHLEAAAAERPDLVDEGMRAAIDALTVWDRRAVRESYEASIFETWWRRVAHDAFDDEVGELLFVEEIVVNALTHLLEHPEDTRLGEALWDDTETPSVETKEEILLGALAATLAELADRFGTDDQTQWRWGGIHTKRLTHPLGGNYNEPPDSLPAREYDAGTFTVSPMTSGFRLVADMDPAGIRAHMVLPGGNSGLPTSPHYRDQADLYFEGGYRPVRFAADEVNQDAEEIWHLRPGNRPTRGSPQH